MGTKPHRRIGGDIRTDIDALIEVAGQQLTIVGDMYQGTLAGNDASRLQVWVKNILENQRSTLDYMATAIVARHGKASKPREKVYFPFARRQDVFQQFFKQCMRGLWNAPPGIRDDIRDAIERFQPYQPGCEWLGHLNSLTTENKHRQLTPQLRMQKLELESGPEGGFIGMRGGPAFKFEGAGTIEIAEDAGFYVNSDGELATGNAVEIDHNLHERTLPDWRFAELNLSVSEVLGSIQRNLPHLISEVCHKARL